MSLLGGRFLRFRSVVLIYFCFLIKILVGFLDTLLCRTFLKFCRTKSRINMILVKILCTFKSSEKCNDKMQKMGIKLNRTLKYESLHNVGLKRLGTSGWLFPPVHNYKCLKLLVLDTISSVLWVCFNMFCPII